MNYIESDMSENGVATVTINRPSKKNALNKALIEELVSTLQVHDQNEKVRVHVVTGSQGNFAAGADINELMDETAQALQLEKNEALDRRAIASLKKPIVAAVEGAAFGGGCEIALMCDIIVCSTTATFCLPEINVGTLPGAGGTQRLCQIAGKYKAMELCLTGRKFGAEEAMDLGIVSTIADAGHALEVATELAALIASKSTYAAQLVKKSVNFAHLSSIAAGLEYEEALFYQSLGSDSLREGTSAFIERRSPNFSNL
ncbi:enoyl-CoA hydratase/isomerase family protein [Haliea sp.]